MGPMQPPEPQITSTALSPAGWHPGPPWGSAQLLCTTVAATDDSGSRCPALLEGIDVIDVHTTCDEGAFITLVLYQKEEEFLLVSFSPVQTRGGETPLQTHEARGIFSPIIKPSRMPPSLLPTVCVYYEGGCAVLWSQGACLCESIEDVGGWSHVTVAGWSLPVQAFCSCPRPCRVTSHCTHIQPLGGIKFAGQVLCPAERVLYRSHLSF